MGLDYFRIVLLYASAVIYVVDHFIFFLKGTMPTTATVDVETTVVSTETPQTTSGNQFYVPVKP